eukprot:ANDGO_04975.mRNA.1 hypothetical protein
MNNRVSKVMHSIVAGPVDEHEISQNSLDVERILQGKKAMWVPKSTRRSVGMDAAQPKRRPEQAVMATEVEEADVMHRMDVVLEARETRILEQQMLHAQLLKIYEDRVRKAGDIFPFRSWMEKTSMSLRPSDFAEFMSYVRGTALLSHFASRFENPSLGKLPVSLWKHPSSRLFNGDDAPSYAREECLLCASCASIDEFRRLNRVYEDSGAADARVQRREQEARRVAQNDQLIRDWPSKALREKAFLLIKPEYRDWFEKVVSSGTTIGFDDSTIVNRVLLQFPHVFVHNPFSGGPLLEPPAPEVVCDLSFDASRTLHVPESAVIRYLTPELIKNVTRLGVEAREKGLHILGLHAPNHVESFATWWFEEMYELPEARLKKMGIVRPQLPSDIRVASQGLIPSRM